MIKFQKLHNPNPILSQTFKQLGGLINKDWTSVRDDFLHYYYFYILSKNI